MYKSIAVTAFATLLAIALPHAYNDYRIYLSYGPGGLPYNPLGWMINHVMMRPFASEQFSTTVYEEKVAAGETLTYLDDEMVTAKKRDRPAVGPHVAPHRQLTDFAGDEIKLVIQTFPTSCACFSCGFLFWRCFPSIEAMFVLTGAYRNSSSD